MKPDVAVKKNGGLFLSLHGVKVEIPPGASTGRRERVVCAAFPSTARAAVAPWLGPYMRMASEMHMLYSPVSFKIPVAVFIPFTFAAAREMSCPNESIPAPVERMKRSESKDSLALDGSRSAKTSPRPKGKAPYTMHFGDHRPKVPNLIDARSVSLLQCRIGSDNWKVVDKFTNRDREWHNFQWIVG
ncbi:unnamed protein product [Trichobilharzia regenti]|nr:unnamed protein product [Trichobilharzia regenti]